MGEGKSSFIVPIVASVLADDDRLVHIIVVSPQDKQMLDMLVAKLGGLLDRPVFIMPFSRSVALSDADLQVIRPMYVECMARGGVMLLQPEHILSFKLMAIEWIISGRGDIMLPLQDFLNKSSRDIVDESDEIFSVKFELVYHIFNKLSALPKYTYWYLRNGAQYLPIFLCLWPAMRVRGLGLGLVVEPQPRVGMTGSG
ncbi:hypothetical protein CRV24_008759 [Beauveria bassiana]|nr:hypothetical protein CRV24_008759 [Beauveria bassiana]